MLAENHELTAVADLLQHGPILVQLQPALVDVVKLGQHSNLHGPLRRLDLPKNQFQQRRLAQSVPPENADALPRGEVQIEVRKEPAPAEFHSYIGQIND